MESGLIRDGLITPLRLGNLESLAGAVLAYSVRLFVISGGCAALGSRGLCKGGAPTGQPFQDPDYIQVSGFPTALADLEIAWLDLGYGLGDVTMA